MLWEDNYLAHYGITGMKWGIRRFQNKDGTLTEAGIKRYRILKEASNYATKKAERVGKELDNQKKFLKDETNNPTEIKNYAMKYSGSDLIADRSAEIVRLHQEKQKYENAVYKWSQNLNEISNKTLREAKEFLKNKDAEEYVVSSEELSHIPQHDIESVKNKSNTSEKQRMQEDMLKEAYYLTRKSLLGLALKKDVSKEDDDRQNKLASYFLNEISNKSGSWNAGEGRSSGFKKIMREQDKILDQMHELENQFVYTNPYIRDKNSQHYSLYNGNLRRYMEKMSPEYKKLSDEFSNLDRELAGVVLKDLGMRDTAENRKYIERWVYYD